MQQKILNVVKGSGGKYLLVGVLSLGVDYVTLIVSYRFFGVPLEIAAVVSFLLGLIVNFLLNKYWSFKAPGGARNGARQAVLYTVLVIINTTFTTLFITQLEKAGIPPEITKPVSTAIITLWNYILYRKVIFKQKDPTDLERSMM